MHWDRSYIPFSQTSIASTKKKCWKMSSEAWGLSQGILCSETGTEQQLSSCLKKELRNKQVWRKAPLKHSTEESGGWSLGPTSALGTQISACTPSVSREKCQRLVTLSDHYCELQKYFPIAKKTARLSCLNCCDITLYDIVKLNARRFFLKDKGFTRS